MLFLECIRLKNELILCAIAHNSWYLLKDVDPSIINQHRAWLYRKDIHVMKTNQGMSGRACIHSNIVTAAMWICAFNLEAYDINEAFVFRGFVLQNCTLYTFKKNEVPIWSPHFISQIPLLQLYLLRPIIEYYCDFVFYWPHLESWPPGQFLAKQYRHVCTIYRHGMYR